MLMNLYAPLKANHSLFDKHSAIIERAIESVHKREFFAQYPEMPSPKVYGETAEAEQKARFEAQLDTKFSRLRQSSDSFLTAEEESPYTGKALGISYPAFSDAQKYIVAGQAAAYDWAKTDTQTRAGILVEALERMKANFFEVAFSTMHTTGQAYLMSFQASGPHAADRALEAIAIGYQELTRFPQKLTWDKPAGKVNLKLVKFYTTVPRGLALAIGCSTFPVWNTLPGLFASLIAGNPVIVKPHPRALYPIAIVVALLQDVLVENGFSPDLVMLAPDTANAPITKILAESSAVKIIDFTGGSHFGRYIESLPGKVTFTEMAGVNSVILDSVDDLAAVAQNLAFSICLYSGQMCTAPQNIFVPASGIKNGEGHASLEEVEKALVEAIKGLAEHPKAGPAVLGAVQSEATYNRVKTACALGQKVLLASHALENPEFPQLRSATPVLIEVACGAKEIYEQEMFGPIAFVIPTADTQESLALASELAHSQGAISCSAYTTSDATMEEIAEAMSYAGTSVSFNLTGGIYVNQNAAFSDFHVTGGNPAGNASLTDPEFVLKRFTRTQARINCPQ
jgi:phenylacetic acid degradation protein paaN